jgi:hypothetical protein
MDLTEIDPRPLSLRFLFALFALLAISLLSHVLGFAGDFKVIRGSDGEHTQSKKP